ncbi:hypothetical protein [Sphingopyxis sp. GC21]|uniref:hypothetical protein n=1 Tax=Sphingopyxis sp. GC21 TaxID=2933562 RepID=UPI0021E36A83|nr:hypothetical protein [Sphingopyxis sp. GC21]
MRIAIFIALLLVALGYAAWKGGGPERVMVVIALTMVALDFLLSALGLADYGNLDREYLALDLMGAAATVTLALVAHRFWPMVAAVLHVLPLLGHISRALDVTMNPIAYLTMQVASSWLLPPLLLVATWRHQQRLRRNGSDPSWHVSWRRSNRSMASA